MWAAGGLGIDLGSCGTGLEALELHLTEQFSMDAHGGFVSALLSSWMPQNSDAVLQLSSECESDITRRCFAEVLHGLGTIAETSLKALQVEEERAHSGEGRGHQQVKCRMEVKIHEWEDERKWWLDHLESCFPTWSKLGKLKLIIRPRECMFCCDVFGSA